MNHSEHCATLLGAEECDCGAVDTYYAAMCFAGHPGSPNYGKPHVPVAGVYDGTPRASCLFCGKWLDVPARELSHP